jgi:hypothetical protein
MPMSVFEGVHVSFMQQVQMWQVCVTMSKGRRR